MTDNRTDFDRPSYIRFLLRVLISGFVVIPLASLLLWLLLYFITVSIISGHL